MRVGIAGISTINADTSKMWALLMNSVRGSNTKEIYEALLTDGERKIFIFSTSSNKNGDDKRSMPALGYELMENGELLCAFQYYGGGMLGMNKNIICIYKDLDAKFKLILAAAATANL